MSVLHYHASVLEIPSAKVAGELKKNRLINRCIIHELDETHWLVDEKNSQDIERQCERLGIQMKIEING